MKARRCKGITMLAPLLGSKRSSVARRLGVCSRTTILGAAALATQGMDIAAELLYLFVLGDGK